jgi:hypothetical protein
LVILTLNSSKPHLMMYILCITGSKLVSHRYSYLTYVRTDGTYDSAEAICVNVLHSKRSSARYRVRPAVSYLRALLDYRRSHFRTLLCRCMSIPFCLSIYPLQYPHRICNPPIVEERSLQSSLSVKFPKALRNSWTVTLSMLTSCSMACCLNNLQQFVVFTLTMISASPKLLC